MRILTLERFSSLFRPASRYGTELVRPTQRCVFLDQQIITRSAPNIISLQLLAHRARAMGFDHTLTIASSKELEAVFQIAFQGAVFATRLAAAVGFADGDGEGVELIVEICMILFGVGREGALR